MTSARIARLADRGVVRVTGADAERLLQGIVSNDMGLLASQPAIHAALLTPQGKILFDFFVVRAGDGFLLEVARDKAVDLAKRLTLYKLRAKVDIQDASAEYQVLALWGQSPLDRTEPAGAVLFTDPRLPALGLRILAPTSLSRYDLAIAELRDALPDDYHAHRIALGVPEGGKDYVLGDTFPHEADLDQLGGVSFGKGCFVGQEVVSRMQNRGNVRKRVVPIEGDGPLPSGGEVRAGAAAIGTVGSVAASSGLALLRLDRAAEAEAKGQALTAGGIRIAVRKPGWATFDVAPAAPAEAP
jgi:tRNA-modifying protein YgfZ